MLISRSKDQDYGYSSQKFPALGSTFLFLIFFGLVNSSYESHTITKEMTKLEDIHIYLSLIKKNNVIPKIVFLFYFIKKIVSETKIKKNFATFLENNSRISFVYKNKRFVFI